MLILADKTNVCVRNKLYYSLFLITGGNNDVPKEIIWFQGLSHHFLLRKPQRNASLLTITLCDSWLLEAMVLTVYLGGRGCYSVFGNGCVDGSIRIWYAAVLTRRGEAVSLEGRDHTWRRGQTLRRKIQIERASLGWATEGSIPLGPEPGDIQLGPATWWP